MDIEKNTTYACRVVRINGEEVDYLSALEINEEYIIRITIDEVERNCYDRIKEESQINIVVKSEEKYLTIVDCQLVETSSRIGQDCGNSKFNLKYMSSLLLVDYLWSSSQENWFVCRSRRCF